MTKFVGNTITLPTLATAPSSPVNGDAYYDTTDNKVYARINGAWVDLAATGATGSFTNNLQINKANSKVQLLNTTSGSGAEDGMYLLMADTDVGYLWNAETNGALVFGTGGAERARITPAGKFGIGTNAPSHQLEVVGPASVTVGVSAGGAGFAELELVGQAGKNYITSDDTLSFDIGGTERATVATTGLNVTSGTLSQGGTAVSLSGHSHSTANITSGNFAATVSGGTGVTVTGGTGNASTPIIAIDTATVPLKSDNLGVFVVSTSAVIGVGTIQLGHASDTTLSRSAAGTLAVEGVDVVTTASTLDASKLSGAVPSAVTGKAKVTYAGTAPTSPNSGDVWIDSSTTTPDVALVDSVSSSSTTAAATANSVKTAYDAAALKAAANTFTVAPQQVTVNSASNKGLIVKAAASQTANLQDWQNSSGTVLASVSSRGMLTSSNIASGRVSITPVANTVTSYAVTGLSVQSSQATTATIADFSILVTPEAKSSNISWWAYEDPTFSGTTLTGFSIYILRSNTTATQFSWMVVGR